MTAETYTFLASVTERKKRVLTSSHISISVLTVRFHNDPIFTLTRLLCQTFFAMTTINDILYDIRLKALTEHEKGSDFERLMKRWFLTDPRYNNLAKVWLWEEFPSRKKLGGKDLGIDLVAQTETGEYWAIQCKC